MRTIIITIFLFFALGISACGSNEPVNLDGKWAANGFDAQITGDHIAINAVSKSTGNSNVYWDGSVPAMGADGDFISVANRDVLDKAVLGSRATTKSFTYDDDTLTFVFTVMGTNTIIHLNRV